MTISNTKDFTVTTINGKLVPRNKCRYIKNEYEINVDCFFMPDNKWHRVNNGLIAFDHETQKWVLIEQTDLYEGIIGVDSNGIAINGWFSPNPIKNVVMNDTMCISDDIPNKLGFVEEISTGTFYPKGRL